MRKNSLKLQVIYYLILSLAVLFATYPIIRVISISLRPGDMLLTTSLRIIPENWTFKSYIDLFTGQPFLRWLGNSIFVAFWVTLIGVALASAAGYSFSRFKFTGRNFGLISIITTQMFPVTMLLLPLFIMLVKLRIYDTFIGLIIAYSATALPFCIWQMKSYYDTIPVSLEEAATIDGCSQFEAFYRVALPLASPGLVITALFSFMSSWSEYLVANLLINNRNLFTLPLGLKQFQSNFDTQWGLYAAGAIIVSIPALFIFLILSRWLISGLTLGSVKG
ncbi:MAG: sugar ABC transporter permease [Fidelibacterota bacterium]